MHTWSAPPHRVVMFSAASPGAGKSTLSSYLARQLTMRGYPVRYFHEHDFVRHPATAEIGRQWYVGDARLLDTWIEHTPTFFAPCLASGETWITDAFYPGFYWLLGQYSPEEVAGFVPRLASLLDPLHPLIVYLDGDPATLLKKRGVAMRGESWRRTHLEYAGTWHLDRYPDAPIRTWEQFVRLVQWRREHSLRLLDDWPGETLIVDVEHTPLAGVKRILLDYLQIEPLPEEAVLPEVLEQAVGTYIDDTDPPSQPLHLTLQGDHLHVNAYWESGALLLPEGNQTFRLDATEQLITFLREPSGRISGLRYNTGSAMKTYRRMGD